MPTVSHGAVIDYQTYYEQLVGWTDGSGAVAYNVNGMSYTFGATDLNSMGRGNVNTTEQYAKLQYYFNLFEKFKLSKVIVKFHPRWTEAIGNYIGDSGAAGTGGLTSGTDAVSNGSTAYFPSIPNVKEFIMMIDDEDVIQRPNNVVEYFQARMQAQSVGTIFHSQECVVTPKYLDSISQDAIATGTDNTAATDVTDTALPKVTEWMSTKVTVAGGATIALNLVQRYNALKWYIYDPYNQNTSPNTYAIGRISFHYYWCFKDLDYRPIVTAVTLPDLSDEETRKKRKLHALTHPLGQIQFSQDTTQFVTPLRKAYIDNPDMADVALSKPLPDVDPRVPGPPPLLRVRAPVGQPTRT